MRPTLIFVGLFLATSAASAAAEYRVTPSAAVESNVVIRRAPTTDSEFLGALAPGTTAQWLGEVAGWYRIEHSGEGHAFVSKAWTEMVDQVDGATPAPAEPPIAGPAYDVYVVDVGTGLAVYARGPDFSLVYDAGTQDDFGNDTNRLLSLLEELGVVGEPIDHLVISHPHRDHISLVADLLEAVRVREVWETGLVYDSCTYEQVLEKIAVAGAQLHTALYDAGPHEFEFSGDCASTGDAVTIDLGPRFGIGTVGLGKGASMTILVADPRNHSDPNENTLVVRLNLGGVGVLLAGDAEGGDRLCPDNLPGPNTIEHDLVTCCAQQLHSEVLVVGHHGSLTSSRRAFLEAVGANDYVVSSGPFPYQGVRLPDRAVLDALQERPGSRLWCTSFQDSECESTVDKLGPDQDGRPGGCNTIHIAISNEGTYQVSGNPGPMGVTEIEDCAHPLDPDDPAPTACN